MRHAGAYWRALAKEGKPVDARIINTSSGAGLQGSVGQGNYSAAKAGIAALTLVGAEMGRYGVTVNAIAPSARTRMTETVFADMMSTQDQNFDSMAPENISPLVVWLGSAESRDVTGRVFEVEGGIIRVAEGWARGAEADKGARWDPAELGPVVTGLLAESRTRCRSTEPDAAPSAPTPNVPTPSVKPFSPSAPSVKIASRWASNVALELRSAGLRVANHHRDHPVGPGLVVIEAGVHLGHLRPVVRSLLLGGIARGQVQHLVLDLNRNLGIRFQIQVPHRIAGRAALRSDQHDAIALAPEQQGTHPWFAGLAA